MFRARALQLWCWSAGVVSHYRDDVVFEMYDDRFKYKEVFLFIDGNTRTYCTLETGYVSIL